MPSTNKPMDFVRGIYTGEHVVLFYEDRNYAERIEFGFIKDGLEKGESCAITTHGRVGPLKERMTRTGIEVDRFTKDGLLHVLRIDDPMVHPQGVGEGIRETYDKLFSAVDEPFRIVSTTFKNIGDDRAYRKEIQLEKKAQKTFDGGDSSTRHDVFRDMEGTIMCTYPVDGFGSQNSRWLGALSANHHAAIFAPRRTEGFAMRMRPVGGPGVR
jgi:hypothetical protein